MTLGEYVFIAAASCLVLLIVLVPLSQVTRFKRVFGAFKLKLPAPTRLVMQAADALTDIKAHYWIWLLPFVLPLLLARFSPIARNRILVLAGLLAALIAVMVTMATFLPMVALIDGITGSNPNAP